MVNQLFSLLLISSLFIFLAPPSFADDADYGLLTGKVLDKNGEPLANATVDLRDWTEDTIGSTISAENGTFVLDHILIKDPCGWNTFNLHAIYNDSGKSYSDKTEFFRIYKNQLTNHDVTIFYYPASGNGWLTGKVVNADNFKQYLQSTIYLDNGMYYFVSGEPGASWQFYLPQGDYQVWAEHNENGRTYVSGKSDVHVKGDDTNTAVLTVSMSGNNTQYHNPPTPGVNVVHGVVTQKNHAPLYGARLELCKVTGRSLDPIMSTTSNSEGRFEFRDVNINSPMENFAVRLVYNFMGSDYTKVSDPFTIYYNNMFNVPHDHDAPISVDFIDSASLELITSPGGAHIWIDGADTGRTTPFNFTGIKAGDHRATLLMDGYMAENLTVKVTPQNTTRLNKHLTPSTGDVFFSIKPSDASVYVNGALAGRGSRNMTRLQYGEYAYMVSREGYRNVSGTFKVLPGGHLDIPVELVAVPGFSLTYFGYLVDGVASTLGNML